MLEVRWICSFVSNLHVLLVKPEMEEWKNIDGYIDYQISSLGRVKSLKYGKERFLKERPDGCGYFQVILCKDGIEHSYKVHKLVALHFIPNENTIDKNLVDHIDRCITNNSVNNLRWVNYSENRLNSYQVQLPMYGITNTTFGKFKVQMNISRVMTYLGCYSSLKEAQEVRNNHLRKLGRLPETLVVFKDLNK